MMQQKLFCWGDYHRALDQDRREWTNASGVEIALGEDDVLILASSVVIDLCCVADNHNRQK